jgi:hypothetical protein
MSPITKLGRLCTWPPTFRYAVNVSFSKAGLSGDSEVLSQVHVGPAFILQAEKEPEDGLDGQPKLAGATAAKRAAKLIATQRASLVLIMNSLAKPADTTKVKSKALVGLRTL